MKTIEQQLKEMQIPPSNVELETCRSSLLGLINLIHEQQKCNKQLCNVMLENSVSSLKQALKTSSTLMREKMFEMVKFTMDRSIPHNITVLARQTNYNIGYDDELKCITIFLGIESNDDPVEAWLTITETSDQEYNHCFVLGCTGDVHPTIQKDFELPRQFQNLEELIMVLKGGLFDCIRLHLENFKLFPDGVDSLPRTN
jgi:hypothetical protein